MRFVDVFKATIVAPLFPQSFPTSILPVAALAALLACATTGHAGSFHVQINTSGLSSSPASAGAPFSLDLQFNDGGVLGNNTVQVTHFSYNGGSATGSANTFGGAIGNISSTVTFDNSSPFQELYQTFTPGTTLDFDVYLTQNLDGLTPDSFVVAILDKDLLNIPTTGVGDSLFQLDVNQATGTLLVMNQGSGTGDYAATTVSSTAAIPEPSSAIIAGIGIGTIVSCGWRRKKSKAE